MASSCRRVTRSRAPLVPRRRAPQVAPRSQRAQRGAIVCGEVHSWRRVRKWVRWSQHTCEPTPLLPRRPSWAPLPLPPALPPALLLDPLTGRAGLSRRCWPPPAASDVRVSACVSLGRWALCASATHTVAAPSDKAPPVPRAAGHTRVGVRELGGSNSKEARTPTSPGAPHQEAAAHHETSMPFKR